VNHSFDASVELIPKAHEETYGNTLLEGVCIRLAWLLHNHDMTHVIWRRFHACLWQLSLSVIRSMMTFLMQIWLCLRC